VLPGARPRPPIVAGRGSAPEEDIAELVQAARHGDATAFTYLYRRHVDRVYDYAARRLPDTHAAEEVTQEVFYRAFRGIAGCREAHLFPGWLFGIARHVIADLYRAPRPDLAPLDGGLDRADPAPTPEEDVLRAEQRDTLLAAREHCLSSSERELLDLLLADLTDREIATALGRRYGAVRTAHWRLLARLRACVDLSPSNRTGGRHVAS
jgi:RNA polymerase sigma-70 factor (ECF subfamily)